MTFFNTVEMLDLRDKHVEVAYDYKMGVLWVKTQDGCVLRVINVKTYEYQDNIPKDIGGEEDYV